MATSLVSRAISQPQSRSTFRLSFNFLRQFSDSASNPIPSSTSKPKKRKKKNLFEVAQFLPNWGIGYHMAKTHWTGVSYQITKINLYKDGRHGKAWGVVHKEGLPAAEAPKKISGVHKRCWKYIRGLSKPTEENTSNPTKPNETNASSAAEVQAA